MTINIFVNHIIGHIATGGTAISSGPKMPTPVRLPQLLVFLLDLTRRFTLRSLHEFAYWDVRSYFCENIYMVARYHTIENLVVLNM